MLPAHRTAESGKNMATIIPALYYSTLNTKMEGYYEAIRYFTYWRRKRRAIAARELNEGLLVLYTTERPGGYFKPDVNSQKGHEEIRRFRARELARLRSFGKKVKVADDILKQCAGQTTIDPPGESQNRPANT